MIERVFYKDKEIILVGTAHISQESVALVKKTIEEEHPDVVGVELCQQRYAQLKSGTRWSETNVAEIIQSGKTYLFLLNLLLANIQRRLGQEVGVKPGEEMLQATRIAQEHEIPISLIDRDVKITLKRAMTKMTLSEKIGLIFNTVLGLFESQNTKITKDTIESLKDKDVISRLMNELSEQAPTIKEVLVDERDIYIANKILRTPGKKIVAIVGAGHLDGIKKYLDKPRDIKSISTIPVKKSNLKYVAYLIPIIFVGMLVYGFVTKGVNTTLTVLISWVLINGGLSAGFVILARGHLLSAIVAFLAAPLTSLHPAFAAGWFAGITEARLKSPKVRDFETLNELNSYSDFSKNGVTHILLVTAFANLGSTIGTVIALPYILSLLA